MASSTKESTVRKSPNETAMRMELREETTRSALEHFHEYGRDRPGVVALWCVGIGFVLGWKLKPW
jgi:hypothetical protein